MFVQSFYASRIHFIYRPTRTAAAATKKLVLCYMAEPQKQEPWQNTVMNIVVRLNNGCPGNP